ncbi:MAG: glycosyltransferase [Candidatus Vogelbacteria bacterium]|nr:glycosyltransferase [Candidatus Vogelbacteria bacterium]
MRQLSIIIPVYNEVTTIEKLLNQVLSVDLPLGIDKEIIIVDDGSTDGTRQVLSKFSNTCRLIFRKENSGKGMALKDGFKAASGDYLLIQDADLEYDPNDYQVLLRPILAGEAETVFGSRTLLRNNVPVGQVYFYGGLLLTRFFNFLFGSRLTDLATCYKLFPSHFVTELEFLPANDFVFDVVQLSHLLVRHSKVLEVPITYRARDLSQGKKLNWRHGWRCFWAMIHLRLSLEDLVRRWRYRQVVNFVKKDALILDIGCGPHLSFLKLIRHKIQKGWGVDKKIIPRQVGNLEIFNVDLDHRPILPLPDSSVEQVFLLAVLEHFYNPLEVLREIKRVLVRKGELVLTTPTTVSRSMLEFLAFRVKLIQPEEILDHKHYFSKLELTDQLKKLGFQDIKHQYFEFGFNHFVVCKK